MYRFLELRGKTAKIKCFDTYDKEEVKRLSMTLKSEEEVETTYIEGVLKVQEIEFLQPVYKRKSIILSKNDIVRLSRYISEIEKEKCKISLIDYYS